MALLRFRLRLPLSLSLSLRPRVYGPFQTCGSEPTRGLSIFQTELKLLGSPLRNIDSLTLLSLSLSPSRSHRIEEARREGDEEGGEEEEEKKIFNFASPFLGKIHFRHRSIDRWADASAGNTDFLSTKEIRIA